MHHRNALICRQFVLSTCLCHPNTYLISVRRSQVILVMCAALMDIQQLSSLWQIYMCIAFIFSSVFGYLPSSISHVCLTITVNRNMEHHCLSFRCDAEIAVTMAASLIYANVSFVFVYISQGYLDLNPHLDMPDIVGVGLGKVKYLSDNSSQISTVI